MKIQASYVVRFRMSNNVVYEGDSMNLKRYIGDRKFYAMVLAIAVPIMVQNGITNLLP